MLRIPMLFAAPVLVASGLAAYGQGQQPPQPFIPFTVDAETYRQMDDAMAKLSMPRDAHAAWLNAWQELERRAQDQRQALKDQAAEIRKRGSPPPEPPPSPEH